jgi:hypothetical protein
MALGSLEHILTAHFNQQFKSMNRLNIEVLNATRISHQDRHLTEADAYYKTRRKVEL